MVPFNGYDRGEHFKGHFRDDLIHFSGFDELQTLQLFVLACALIRIFDGTDLRCLNHP